MTREGWPQVAVLGAGAVGSYFGGMLARAGAPVTLVGRAPHVDAIHREGGLILERNDFRERVALSVSTAVESVSDASLVLFAVKTTATDEAARELAPWLSRDAIVVSLQNGVDNVERMRASAGINAVAASVYVAARIESPGHVIHSGRGDLIVGSDDRGERLERIAELFRRASVPCVVSRNIAGELWTKLVLNCAYNAISALSRARYGKIAEDSETREVMARAVDEVVAVGRASGVRFTESDLVASALKLASAMPEAISSTAQDLLRGKKTEIDSLNGYVVRRGAELGIETPVNRTLYALVKLLERESV